MSFQSTTKIIFPGARTEINCGVDVSKENINLLFELLTVFLKKLPPRQFPL